MATHSALLEELNRREPRTAEEMSLSLLARRRERPPFPALTQSQLACGGWSNDMMVAWPNAYVTGLALQALSAEPGDVHEPAEKAFAWLGSVRPKESQWLYRWKFNRSRKSSLWDPAKLGWPWVEGTVSWVGPTSLVILAHRAWRKSGPRVSNAEAMLLDRACVNGGWNYGNSVVFGQNLDAHPDFTAMALLALRDSPSRGAPAIGLALDYLGGRLTVSGSPYSLSWAVMALSAYDDPRTSQLRDRLDRVLDRNLESISTAVLALSALALEETPFTFRGGAR